MTAAAAAQRTPTGSLPGPGSWKEGDGRPESAVWVIPSIWHHIWCQRFGYCFTYFISRRVLRDETRRPQRLGVRRKNPLLSESLGHKVNTLLWLL